MIKVCSGEEVCDRYIVYATPHKDLLSKLYTAIISCQLVDSLLLCVLMHMINC